MVGVLPNSGRGEELDATEAKNPAGLHAHCKSRNDQLWWELVGKPEGPDAAELFRQAEADIKLGRMSPLQSIDEVDLAGMLINPRFGISQVKADGTCKVRSVDHMSWSPKGWDKGDCVNGYTTPTEKIRHETLDALADAMKCFVELEGDFPGSWKADIDSAFRRIPICPADKWACAIGFKHKGRVLVSTHNAAMFGAAASVHAWERVGEALTHIARSYLHLPVLRYVDDYFAVDRSAFVFVWSCLLGPHGLAGVRT